MTLWCLEGERDRREEQEEEAYDWIFGAKKKASRSRRQAKVNCIAMVQTVPVVAR